MSAHRHERPESTVAKLLAQRQQLLERLESDPGPSEREKIQTLLTKIETALALLDPQDAAGAIGKAC